MPISALPTPPSRQDPANFATRSDAFLAALPTFTTEANALASQVTSMEADTLSFMNQAQAAAASAATVSGVARWVTGTTYAQYAVVYSPADFKTYRKKTASSVSTVDPSADATNWALVAGMGNASFDASGFLAIGPAAAIRPLHISSTTEAAIVLDKTNAGTDQRLWRMYTSNNTINIASWDDAATTTALAYQAVRTANSITEQSFSIGGSVRLRMTSSGINIRSGTLQINALDNNPGYLVEARVGSYAGNMALQGYSLAAYASNSSTDPGWRSGMFMSSDAGGIVSFILASPSSDTAGSFGVSPWIRATGLTASRVTTIFAAGTTAAVTISANANVGIGTTTPDSFFGASRRLAIQQDQNAATVVIVGNATVGATAGSSFAMATGTANSNVFLILNDNNGSPTYNVNLGSAVSSYNINFNGTNRLALSSAGAASITGTLGVSSNATVGGTFGVTGATTLSSTLAVTGNITMGGVDVGYRVLPVVSTAGTTAALADRGKAYFSTGTITIPGNVFAAGDTFVIYNNSAATINIALGAGLTTLRFAGSATAGPRTLLQRGIATVMFVSATEAVISGAGVA